MEDEVKAAVFGNVGTMITFRVGATDAEAFEKEFAPYFILDDFVNLSAFQIYLRLMIDGAGSKPFSAHTLGPPKRPAVSHAQAIIAHSRATYGKPVFDVMEEVNEFYKPTAKEVHTNGLNSHGDENVLKVRAIRNSTPLPPQESPRPARTEYRNNEWNHGEKRNGVKNTTPYGHTEYRQDKHHGNYADTHVKTEPPIPKFDEKPAMSLKDALAKAMAEKTETPFPSHNVHTNGSHEDTKKKKKEVQEDVLRKLILEE